MKFFILACRTAAGLALCVASLAHAQGYLSAQIGFTSPHDDTVEDNPSYLLGVGANLNEHLALEASYLSLGKFDASGYGRSALSSSIGYPADFSVAVSGPAVGAEIMAPFRDNLSVFARAGVFLWRADYDLTIQGVGSTSDSTTGNDPYYGVGLNFRIDDQVSVKADYGMYRADQVDNSNISVGARLLF